MPSGCLEAGLRFLLKDSEFVDRKLIRALRYSGTARNPSLIPTPVKTGVHPPVPLTWIPFFNGMTDAVVTWMPAGVYPETVEGPA
jgi:hypothetical protein